MGFTFYGLMLLVACAMVWTLPAPERALWAVMLAVWAIRRFHSHLGALQTKLADSGVDHDRMGPALRRQDESE